MVRKASIPDLSNTLIPLIILPNSINFGCLVSVIYLEWYRVKKNVEESHCREQMFEYNRGICGGTHMGQLKMVRKASITQLSNTLVFGFFILEHSKVSRSD